MKRKALTVSLVMVILALFMVSTAGAEVNVTVWNDAFARQNFDGRKWSQQFGLSNGVNFHATCPGRVRVNMSSGFKSKGPFGKTSGFTRTSVRIKVP